ncbi:MalY/PatB family protein [Crassaminicella profunda]|uniref:MalY/PatB family protein n=1 Tax=Crassaminicella profunda TaxID=1286698 RepID=UPI001CA65417|nr:MalY/PatB family protein [Crassaminicella profunda]QZY55904.1 pyridoxal phosphate-dependent aminotransferase [Crassaminicella profunda]
MKGYLNEIIDRKGTNSMKWDKAFLKKQFGRGDLLPLWVADMDFKCPQSVIHAIIKRAEHGIFGYSFRDDSYDEAVVSWNKKRHNWEIHKDWIVFTPGVVPALNYLIQAFCLPGDKVIIQDPVYYPFRKAIIDNGCQVVYNSLKMENGYYRMDFDDLEEKVKDSSVKFLILCSPHNPVGRVWEKEELVRLGKICIKNNVMIVADEIHSDLILKGHKHIPFASISEEFAQNSIICTAPSKTFNLAGLQMSNIIIANEKLRTCFKKVLTRNHVELSNTFGIVALTAAYKEGEEWLEDVLDYLGSNVDFIEQFVKEKMPQVKFIRPQGTYLGWLDFRDMTKNKKELEDIFINKAKVALDAGYWFGKDGEGFARINFACPQKTLEEALNRIERAIYE